MTRTKSEQPINAALLSDEEIKALLAICDVPTPTPERRTAKAFWFQWRVDLLAVIALGYVVILLGFAPQVASRLDISSESLANFIAYLHLRGGFLVVFLVASVWSWLRDWHPEDIQLAMLILGASTFLIDSVLIYANVKGPIGFYFSASIVFRLTSIWLLWSCHVNRAFMPEPQQRRLLGFKPRWN